MNRFCRLAFPYQNDDLRIESGQLRYRKLIKWPRLYSLMDFPLLAGQLEQCLDRVRLENGKYPTLSLFFKQE